MSASSPDNMTPRNGSPPYPLDKRLFSPQEVQENQVGLKLNGTHQLLAYADGVNTLGDNIGTINKNTGNLIDASKEVGLEVNVEKTKCMLVSHDQNAGQIRDLK
jgi:hypothetical protein